MINVIITAITWICLNGLPKSGGFLFFQRNTSTKCVWSVFITYSLVAEATTEANGGWMLVGSSSSHCVWLWTPQQNRIINIYSLWLRSTRICYHGLVVVSPSILSLHIVDKQIQPNPTQLNNGFLLILIPRYLLVVAAHSGKEPTTRQHNATHQIRVVVLVVLVGKLFCPATFHLRLLLSVSLVHSDIVIEIDCSVG